MKAIWRSDLADVLTCYGKSTEYAEAAGMCPYMHQLSGSALELWTLSIWKYKQWPKLAATEMCAC